jgi:hypothetical protein
MEHTDNDGSIYVSVDIADEYFTVYSWEETHSVVVTCVEGVKRDIASCGILWIEVHDDTDLIFGVYVYFVGTFGGLFITLGDDGGVYTFYFGFGDGVGRSVGYKIHFPLAGFFSVIISDL